MLKKRFFKTAAALMAVCTLLTSVSASACTTVLVGKDASADGSTIIARNEDSSTANPKYFVVHEAKKNPAGTKHVSKGNGFVYELPETQYKYTATPEWTDEFGLYEEAGTNEKGVAMSGTESGDYNQKVAKADPLVENGIAEDSIVTVVLPYISTAREGVKLLGEIVEKYGSAECNGVAFSDKDEVWYMEILSGHHWVARRIPDNYYAVVANQISIRNVDFKRTNDFMWSTGIQEFVEKNKLNSSKTTFNVRNIFGTNDKDDASYNICRVWDGQRILTPSQKDKYSITSKKIPMLQKPDKKITVEMVQKVLTSHYNGTKYDTYGKAVGNYRAINVQRTMESHIIQWRQNMPVEISGVQWMALGTPEHSVYVPFYNGITDTPEAYKKGEDMPSSDSAYWIFKLTDVLTTPYYDTYMSKYVLPEYKLIKAQLNANMQNSDRVAMELYKTNPDKLAEYLTEEGMKNANYTLKRVTALNNLLIQISTNARNSMHNSNL